jgi:hypothetical protein
MLNKEEVRGKKQKGNIFFIFHSDTFSLGHSPTKDHLASGITDNLYQFRQSGRNDIKSGLPESGVKSNPEANI